MNVVTKAVWHTIQATLITLTIAGAIFILVNALLALLPRDVAEGLTNKMRLTVGLGIYNSPELSDEGENANGDHEVVSKWIERCIAYPREQLPEDIQALLTGIPGSIVYTDKKTESVSVSPLYIRLAHLSRTLLQRRIALDIHLSSSYRVAQVGAFLSILIGLLTTVLVGLSSTDIGKQETRIGLGIRVTALALPALGTAVAAVIAFYDPSGNLGRQSQVAAGLQQLHSQISTTTWKMTCETDQSGQVSQEITARLDSWTQRMQDLIASIGDSRVQAAGAQSKSTGQNAP